LRDCRQGARPRAMTLGSPWIRVASAGMASDSPVGFCDPAQR
jgi:hypothetical protein